MKQELFQSVLLSAARESSRDATLNRLVSGLAEDPSVALARIWLLEPGDICDVCALRDECPDQRRCLHLVASAGASKSGEKWNRLDGGFRRFPLGIRKVGMIALHGPKLIADVGADMLVQPDWASAEGIQSFAGHPLCFNDEVLGVLAIFCRSTIREEDFRWIRVFADHASASIANANALDEIRQLHKQVEQENEYLREEVRDALEVGAMVSASPALQKVLQQVELVAPTVANVLIQGESGTGKELIARSIHERSHRGDRPMIKVNCATIPRELFESEFFGHVKGSYTGAVKDRVGRFELADGGTLFLDEVGEIPIELQSKPLRVLQEGEFERVGDATVRKVDVRVISATNRDLLDEIRGGGFRQDLFYRLSVFPIDVPPLRERPEDIEPLAHHFVRSAAKKHSVSSVRLTRRHVRELQSHQWPGNVRELQHVIERAVILASGGKFDPGASLPRRTEVDVDNSADPRKAPSISVDRGEAGRSLSSGLETSSRNFQATDEESPVLSLARLKELERNSIRAALKQSNGRVYGIGGAAEILGTKPTTLSSRIKALGIDKSK